MSARGRRGRWIAASVAAAGAVAATARVAWAQTAGSSGAAPQTFEAQLVPLNGSGVTGAAFLSFTSDGKLAVAVVARGATPNQQHAQHIHRGTASAMGGMGGTGGTSGSSAGAGGASTTAAGRCPILRDDANHDHLISQQEGEAVYGPPLMPLQPFPQVTATDGSYIFAESGITPSGASGAAAPSASSLAGMVVVVHGMTIDGAYDPTAPAACGGIVPLEVGSRAGQPSGTGGTAGTGGTTGVGTPGTTGVGTPGTTGVGTPGTTGVGTPGTTGVGTPGITGPGTGVGATGAIGATGGLGTPGGIGATGGFGTAGIGTTGEVGTGVGTTPDVSTGGIVVTPSL